MVKKNYWNGASFSSCDSFGCRCFCLYLFIQQGTETLAKTYKKIGEETKVIEATEPLTILLMGLILGMQSVQIKWAGNSDSMILLTVNPHTKKTMMLSLERDILTKIQHKDGSIEEAKLNAAYAGGGAEFSYFNYSKDDEYPYRSLHYG